MQPSNDSKISSIVLDSSKDVLTGLCDLRVRIDADARRCKEMDDVDGN